MTVGRRLGFAGAAAVLMLVQAQVQALAVEGAAAVLMLVQVQALALDRRFSCAETPSCQ